MPCCFQSASAVIIPPPPPPHRPGHFVAEYIIVRDGEGVVSGNCTVAETTTLSHRTVQHSIRRYKTV